MYAVCGIVVANKGKGAKEPQRRREAEMTENDAQRIANLILKHATARMSADNEFDWNRENDMVSNLTEQLTQCGFFAIVSVKSQTAEIRAL